ncbi:hypothetical protein BA92_02510 [Sanguibacteroides justesenii]|uniref:Uncharacterized protein n=1 Tax=Sanguibacteroides justesenii TaxID=1547597 RepID=A0A0C3RHL5_9PORP|nr:hypothetical protein BA92_02510 [Sanguibacteroides justesenii]
MFLLYITHHSSTCKNSFFFHMPRASVKFCAKNSAFDKIYFTFPYFWGKVGRGREALIYKISRWK